MAESPNLLCATVQTTQNRFVKNISDGDEGQRIIGKVLYVAGICT